MAGFEILDAPGRLRSRFSKPSGTTAYTVPASSITSSSFSNKVSNSVGNSVGNHVGDSASGINSTGKFGNGAGSPAGNGSGEAEFAADMPSLRSADAMRQEAARKSQLEVARGAVELFGSFMLAGEEYALPAVCIREVVNFPAKITPIPLSPGFLEGVFTLRGMVIPVVNLARLFDPAAPAADPSQTIAIIDHDQVQVGILFQSTGEIMRVRPEQRSTLQYKGADKHGVVAGTILLEEGARLLQILDAAALIRIENVPHVLALRAAGRQREDQHLRAQQERRQCVSFRAGGTLFAFEMLAIQEIIKVPELSSSVLNNRLCLGRLNFRGSPVAVVDFSALLNAGAAPATPADLLERRILVLRIAESTIGFLVDSVNSIINFFSDDLLPIPLLSKSRARMFGGCLAQPEGADVILLDHAGIFSQTEIVDMRNGHDNLFKHEGAAVAEAALQGRRAQRHVYITFTLDSTFAVEIEQIREIIDHVGPMTKPPGIPDFMCGILNLRQQMISVIDLRTLYGMAPMPDPSKAKILIIERGAERYGLLVDAVENILTVADSNRYPAPKMIRNAGSDDLRSEMDEVLDLGQAEGRKTLSVFQNEVLLQRLARQWPAGSPA